MAIKPTDTFTWATDATFGSGPANGQPTKLPPGTPAQGFVPGNAIVAEWSNTLENITGQWTGWLFAGSSDPTDQSAHIVETNVSGIAGIYQVFAGNGASTDSAIVAQNDSAGNATIVAINTSTAPAGVFQTTTGSAVQGLSASTDPAEGAFEAIITGNGASGFVSDITTAGSRGVNISVNAANAAGVFVDVTGGIGASGVFAQTSAVNAAIEALSTSGGVAGQFTNSSSGIGIIAQNTGTGIGLSVGAASGVPLFCGTNNARGSLQFESLAAYPAIPEDGSLAYVEAGGTHQLASFFDYGSGIQPFQIHKSTDGNFGGFDGTAGIAVTGALNAPTTVATINASIDEMPQNGAADAIVHAQFDISSTTAISGTPPEISVRIEDTTAGALVGGQVWTGWVIRQQGDIYSITVRLPYTIPGVGLRNFILQVSNQVGGGETLSVRNVSLAVSPAKP